MDENGPEGTVTNSDGGNTSAELKPRLEVKSSPNERAESPDSNCAICLGKLQNKSFTDSCLHQFCFSCLVEWSKVKPECPLCKQGFKSIIHNVRSIEDYDQYDIFRPVEQPTVSIRNFAQLLVGSNRPAFRFRTTMGPVIGLLQRVDSFIPPVYTTGHHHHHHHHHRPGHSTHSSHRDGGGSGVDRRYIYDQGLWVRRLPDITGRYRKCSPRFLAQNPAQVHRLVPWLHREINALLGRGRRSDAAISEIINMVVQYPIRSVEFRNGVETYLGALTDQFIHEFHSFAISPYDTIGYDRNASYGPEPLQYFEEEPDSSSSDSDVQIVDVVRQEPVDLSSNGESRTASPEPGPSGFVANVAAASASASTPSCIDITSSDLESDLEDCVVVGTVKPRHLRTPEVITISDDGGEEENGVNDEQNLNIDQVCLEEDVKPTPAEIAQMSAESCKPSTSKHHSRENISSRYPKFKCVFLDSSAPSSDSERDSSSSSSSTSSEEERNESSKRKRTKKKQSKKKSKASGKRKAVSKSRKRETSKRTKREFFYSESGSSDDESDYKRKRPKRKRALSNSSSSSSHSHSRSPKVETSPVTTPRLRSVVHVRRNTQDSYYSGDAASCSGASSNNTGSAGSHHKSRLTDEGAATIRLEITHLPWSPKSSHSSSSTSTSTSSSGREWYQQCKYKYKRKHN